MSDQEQRRAEILSRLSSGSLSVAQASTLLGVTARQVRRLRTTYQAAGLACVPYGNRGKAARNKLSSEQVAQVLSLAGSEGAYFGFSVCHLAELLQERHDLTVGRSTLDRLLRQKGVTKRSGKSKTERRHSKRQRQSAEGMLLQIDGSPHPWLETRGPKLCLMGAIDDATGKVVYLRFHPTECQEAYLRLVREICTTYGLPMAFYHDRHTILRSPKETTIDDELAGRQPMSQVQRVLHELGVESIVALSPQAKGRVERLWKTLQDRLVKEMRLEVVDTMEAANAFLPCFLTRFLTRFNARFAVAAADAEPVWVALAEDADRARLFSTQEMRVVRADQTLSFLGKTLLVEGKRSFARQRVAVHLTPDGELFLYCGEKLRQRLDYKVVPHKDKKDKAVEPIARNGNSATENSGEQTETTRTNKGKNSKLDKAKRNLTPGQAAWLYGRKWT